MHDKLNFFAMPDPETNFESVQQTEGSAKSDKECIGCKVVAFVTPLLAAGYMMSHASKETVAELAKTKGWVGKNRWIASFHRFNMMFTLPLSKLFSQYSAVNHKSGLYFCLGVLHT